MMIITINHNHSLVWSIGWPTNALGGNWRCPNNSVPIYLIFLDISGLSQRLSFRNQAKKSGQPHWKHYQSRQRKWEDRQDASPTLAPCWKRCSSAAWPVLAHVLSLQLPFQWAFNLSSGGFSDIQMQIWNGNVSVLQNFNSSENRNSKWWEPTLSDV